MTTLFEHIRGWYWSPFSKVSENTFITNREQEIRWGAGIKGGFIGKIPANTLVTIDMEEIDEGQGWYRIYKLPGVSTYVYPDWLKELEQHIPTKELRQAWIDRTALTPWSEPVDDPEPIEDPQPDPVDESPLANMKVVFSFDLFGYTFAVLKPKK